MSDWEQEMRDFIIAHKQDIDTMQIDKVVRAYIDEFINPIPFTYLLDDAGIELNLSPFCTIMNFLCSYGFDDEYSYTIKHFSGQNCFLINYDSDGIYFDINAHDNNPAYVITDRINGKNYSYNTLEELLKGIENVL